MYIELLKKVLTDLHKVGLTEYKPIYVNKPSWKSNLLLYLDRLLRKKRYAICQVMEFAYENHLEGRDWPSHADTMIGIKRLNNIEYCINKIIEEEIPGDFIETGVWRGGATIFMKALLKVNNINDRVVWVADSFEGLPEPDEKYAEDKGSKHHIWEELAIPLEQVMRNFEKYNLLDDNVKFLKGWFKDTLPSAPIQKLSLLRLDGDLYESTMDGLKNLYPKLTTGGFIIIDDWGAVKGCKQAVIDYRQQNEITTPVETIDWSGVYWKKDV